ncbi:hypothetical protein ACFWN5_41005 [Streptomyces sp. NPDC058430]|uniref:hypothetical protein n=1 Tax=Streptomyces sp. NPDC058430 TaxID=3346495 RepID=UPI00366084AE
MTHASLPPSRGGLLAAAALPALGSTAASVVTAQKSTHSAMPGKTPAAGADLGPNVIVFDPSTPGIQAKLDEIFNQQGDAQFGAPTPTPSMPPSTRASTSFSRPASTTWTPRPR